MRTRLNAFAAADACCRVNRRDKLILGAVLQSCFIGINGTCTDTGTASNALIFIYCNDLSHNTFSFTLVSAHHRKGDRMNGGTDTFHKPFRGNLYHNYSISPVKSQRLVLARMKFCAACQGMRKFFVKSNNSYLTLIDFTDFSANSDSSKIGGQCTIFP
jgi:hypothetical protein